MSACLNPRKAWFADRPNLKGRDFLLFSTKPKNGYFADRDREIEIPCGKCVCCVEAKGSALSVRLYLDWVDNGGVGCFGTLTYSPEHLPADGRLDRRDAEKFVKRLDFHLRKAGLKWRGVMCGEYGKLGDRPHYHFILIGADLCSDDERVSFDGVGGDKHISALLQQLWPLGHSEVTPMTPGRAQYVGMHCIKNLHQPDAFRMMSRRPGIGYGWLDQLWPDLLKGFITIEGVKVALPPEFLKRESVRELLEPLRERRREFAEARPKVEIYEERSRRESKAANIVAKRRLFSGVL